ncbi:MAG: BlaI/MecI/CopY family transcriptional regulator [Gemmatimonadales bacterium]
MRPTRIGDRSLKRLLDTVYQGSRELLIARLVSDQNVSAEELRRIRRMLDERLEELEER